MPRLKHSATSTVRVVSCAYLPCARALTVITSRLRPGVVALATGLVILAALSWQTTAAGVGAAAGAAAAQAEVGTLLLAPQDTSLNLNANNYSTDTVLTTYTWPDYQVANAVLMKFDLSSVPAGAAIQEATLHLALVASDGSADGTYTVTAHKVAGRTVVISGATGQTADGSTTWTPNACCYDNVPLAQANISAAYDVKDIDKVAAFKTWTITSMVEEWLADPTTNAGVLLNSDASRPGDRYRFFASMEHPDATLRPFLRIRFAATDATPPTIAVTSPAPGAAVAGVVPVTADAADNVGVAAVQFQVNGFPIGPELTAAPYAVNWDTRTLSDGSYTLGAVARDGTGNSGVSAAVGVAVTNGRMVLTPQDTSLNTNTNNYSTGTVLTTYTWPSYKVANAILMKFDLTALPPGALVTGATLHLALVQSDSKADATYTVSAHKVIGKSPVIARATGYSADGVVNWTASQCCYNGVPLAQADISPAYDSRGINKTPGVKTWTMTNIVQEWLTDPASNFGLLLNSDASKTRDRYRFFASMEHPDPSLRPYLSVTFTAAGDTPPSVAITAPAPGAIVSNTVTVAADASDDAGITGVQFQLDGAPLGAELTAAPYVVNWNTATAADGAHTLTAVARDAAGHSTASAPIGVTVTNDTTPPVIAAATALGVTASGATISWTTDEPSDSQVEYGTTTAYGTTTPVSTTLVTSHVVALSGLAQTTQYQLRVRSRDQAGNLAMSANVTFTTLDGTAPTVSVTAPAAGVTVSGTVTVAASATDNVGVDGVQFKLDGASLGAEDTIPPYSVSWNTTTAVNGAHALTAVARDAAGNVRTSSGITVTVANDTTPPVISAIVASSITASSASILWTTNEASDSQVEYGTTTAYGSTTPVNTTLVTSHVVTLSGLAQITQHQFRVRSRDQAGNLRTSANFTFTTRDGTAPAVSVTAPAAGATVSGTVSVAASATDNVGVAGVQFKLDGASLGAEDAVSPYSISWNTTTAANGGHTLTAVARDGAGNQTTAAGVTVSVSNTAPPPSGGIAALYPGDVGIENDANVVLVERFDEATLANLFAGWTDVLNGSAMSFSTDVPAGSPVTRSLNIPWSTASSGGHLYKPLTQGVADTLHVRYYVKYPTSGSYQHEGAWMGGSNPALSYPNPQAGIKPTGSDRFSAAAEQSDDLSRFDHYDYWTGMRQAADGNYWGNTLLNNPGVKATPGQWMCVEHMVKLNNPATALNGEHAIWINGVKVSHLGQGFPNGYWSGGNFIQDPGGSPFDGFQWRSTTSLDLNWIWLQVYAPNGGSGSIKYAHVVAATSYVGCLASGAPDMTPPTVSLTSPGAGATVSGTVTVAAGASDNMGVAGVQFKLDGANLGTEDTTSPYSISWNTTTTANGSHTLTGVARDGAGNVTTSAGVTVTVSNGATDTAPPTVSLTSPSAGATVSGTITVAANASDNVGVAGVQFKLDGANLGAEDTTSPYSLSWDTTAAASGAHTLTAAARDAAGNPATGASVSVSVSNASGGAAVFTSNWDTASGTSTNAVTDGGRWPNYWEFNNGSAVQLLSVVSGGVNGHNALRVQQRGSTYAANLQIDNVLPQSRDYYLRYYMKNDDTSNAGDHIVTADTYNYANLTYMRKYGSALNWNFVVSLYGCGYTYPIGHWGPSVPLVNGQWYRFEYYVHYTDATHVQVHPRVYDATGLLILSDAQFLQSDFGGASWNGRSDWTLASYYAAGNTFCVSPTWMNDFGLGNNGQYGAADTGQYWYFSALEIRTDRWPGPVQ